MPIPDNLVEHLMVRQARAELGLSVSRDGRDLGAAIGTGTVVAIAAVVITLVRDAIEALAHRALATICGNLLWAFDYNVVIIPLAVVGLFNPTLAAGGAAGRSPARRSGICGPSGSSSPLPG
ncbi:hypothetical protein [Streptomyces sp. NPDC056255]|uniref:hypothetical protein n=1 Tax=Streptomyces sp. NPDC056255 TaxID=3345764 RepID=UPI0035D6AEC3